MDELVRKGLSRKIRALVRLGRYQIDSHAYADYPERKITIDDILEVLKVGEIEDEAPNVDKSELKYTGEQRYIWYGIDIKDRPIRLIIKVTSGVLVISAAHPSAKKARAMLERYKE